MAQEPSKKELYDAAQKMDKEEWSPKKALGNLGASVLKKIMPKETAEPVPPTPPAGLPEGKKKGGKVGCKCMASGGKVSSASKRADGCAIRGKTRA